MARKLDAPDGRASKHEQSFRFGRRSYIKAGIMSTMVGATLVGSSMSVAGQETQSVHVVGTGGLSAYDITVSGELTDAEDTTYDATGNISGRNAEGVVEGGVHGYWFQGELVDISLRGEATVYLNGARLDESEIER